MPPPDATPAPRVTRSNLSAHSPREIHALHAGDLARPEGDCLQCHEDDGRFLVARANACSGCHADFAKKAPHDAKKLSDSACASCHSPETVRSAHLGAKEKTAREGLKSLVSVDLTDAKVVRDAGKPYAEVTFRLLDAEGRPVPLALDTAYNPDSNAHPAVDFKVNAYASPMAATCFACHAYTRDSYGKAVKNAKAKAHITEMGGKFGVKLEELQPERCNTCHTPEALGKAHGLKR